MRILKKREYVTAVTYTHQFNYKEYGSEEFRYGFGFDCAEDGTVDRSKLKPNGLKNYEACLTGQVNGKAVVDLGITRYDTSHTEPAIGECNHCKREVTLSQFTNTCDCGTDYNMSGQELAPRSQWGEETGETADDILRFNYDSDFDLDY